MWQSLSGSGESSDKSEDEDLHQCGRCRTMFRRLSDYFAHKERRCCRSYLDCSAQTSPQPGTSDPHTVKCQPSRASETADLSTVVGLSLQASLGEELEDHSSHVPPTICEEQQSVADTSDLASLASKDIGCEEPMVSDVLQTREHNEIEDISLHETDNFCRNYLDSADRTLATSAECGFETAECRTSDVSENHSLPNVVKLSLQASLGDDEPLVEDCSPPCSPSGDDEPDTAVTASDSGTDTNVVTLHSVVTAVSLGSSAEDMSEVDLAVNEGTSSLEPLPADETGEPNDAHVGHPEAPPPHQCPQCDFTSKFRDDFDQHLRRQHGLSSHVCVDCSRAFTDAYKLRRHQRVYCTKNPVSNKLKSTALIPGNNEDAPKFMALDKRKKPTEDDSEIPFRCRICSETFDDYDGVWSHVAAAHSAMARPGICRFCGAWFANPYKLRRHVSSSVHDDVPGDAMTSFKRQIDRMSISCTPEAVRLLRRARIEQRQQLLGAAGSRNECSLCGRTFSARSALVRHRKVIHGRRLSGTTGSDTTPTISCQLCGASFDRRRAYLRHRRDEHRKLPVVRQPPASKKCLVCDRTFARPDAAVKHHAKVHTAVQQVPDDLLAQSMSIEVDEKELTGAGLDADTTATCFVCSQPSPTRPDLVRHLELFHRIWVPLLDGPFPPGLFDDTPGIPPSLRHIDDALAASQPQHRGPSSTSTAAEGPGGQKVPDVGSADSGRSRSKARGDVSSGRWACPYCQQGSFNSVDALYRHKVGYHRLEAVFRCLVTSCRSTFRLLTDYEAHVTSSGHSQAAFICSVCNEHLADLLGLLSHRGSAHNSHRRRPRHSANCSSSDTPPSTSSKQSGPVLCDQCGQTFRQRSALMRHRAVEHKQESCRRYACTQCDRRFVKHEHLQRHVISRHATARPYVCRATGCGRAFKRKDKLQEHYWCHSTDRLYACSVCGRTYRQRAGLKHHERTHQPTASAAATDKPERRRSCRRCPATFNRACKLAEHLRAVHGRGAGKDVYAHRCDVCGKTFPRPERVRRHAEREHNVVAQWSHRCTVCGKGFAGLRSYELHMTRHESESGGGGGGARVDGGKTTRRCRRRAKPNPTSAKKTTSGQSPRVVVVTGRHQSSSTAACEMSRLPPAVEPPSSQSATASTSRGFNRFFVPSTPSGQQHQFDKFVVSSSSELRSHQLSRINAHAASVERLNCADRGSTQAAERLYDSTIDNITSHRRLSFEPLPYLHHPSKSAGDYSYYSSGYHHAPHHRTQFGLYPSAPGSGFGYSSHSAAACAGAPRGCGLFPADRTAAAATALPFGVQSGDPSFGGQSVDGRATDFSGGFGAGLPCIRASDYDGGSGGAAGASGPLRPLATQPPAAAANAYCPVPDPSSVGRWFDSVPTLLPPSMDASNLDSVRWPPRPCIDSFAVRPRYPFGMTPTTRYSNQQLPMTSSAVDSRSAVGGPGWSSVDHSCLFNCSRMPAVDCVLGSRRCGVGGDWKLDRARDVDCSSLYGATAGGHRDGTSVPRHGMLSLLPPW